MHPLLPEILAKLGAARVESGPIMTRHRGYVVLGLCESDNHITINEAQLIGPTVIHELVHAVRPEASEHAVECLTAKVWKTLSDADVEAVYRAYMAAKRRHRTTPVDAD